MKHTAVVIGVVTAGALALGTGTALAAGTHGSRTRPTVASVQAKVDGRAVKATARLDALRAKVDANAKLSADQKATLDADITKTVADIATKKATVDAATTLGQVRAARDGVVKADLAKLKADRAAVRAARKG